MLFAHSVYVYIYTQQECIQYVQHKYNFYNTIISYTYIVIIIL